MATLPRSWPPPPRRGELRSAGYRPRIPWARRGRNRLGALLAAVLLLASCAGPRGLVPVADPGREHWPDDASRESLEAALEQSLRYYERLPATAAFTYGSEVYTAPQMAASLELFRRTLAEAPSPEAFEAALAERFLVFESVALQGENLFTGYFEPVIEGSLTPTDHLATPIYGRPADLVEIPLTAFGRDLPNVKLYGRIEGRRVVPYYSRQEIQEGQALAGTMQPIAYVNEVDLFFLQIQGSGLVSLPDGEAIRVNYEASNGQPYRSIGAHLIRSEILSREEVSLQTIRRYLSENPDQVRPLLFSNPSYIFFRLVDEGPLGNIEVPLTPGRSLALDHRLFPKGGLAYVRTDVPVPGDPAATRPLARFMLVQDTGGAIRGHGRADLFWGRGADARWIAGHLKHGGRLFLLVARKEHLPAAAASVAEHAGRPVAP